MEIPKLDKNKCSLIFAEYSTGNIHNSDLTLFNKFESKTPYQIFDHFDDAEFFALEFIKTNPNFECLIYDENGQFIKMIDRQTQKIHAIQKRLEILRKTDWKAFIEGRDFSSGSSFIMVNSENGRENDIEILGASHAEIDFIANSKEDIEFLLKEISKLNNQLNKK